MAIQKTYQYKVYTSTGTYLGLLTNYVISPFNYNQNVQTAGVQITVTVQQNPLSVDLPITPIQDEQGNNILDENNNVIYEESAQDVIYFETQSNNPTALIKNGNKLVVVEYSSYTPNGKTKFSGFMQKVKFSTLNNTIELTCLSGGADMNNYLVAGGYILQVQDLTADGTQNVDGTFNSGSMAWQLGNTFIPASSYSVAKISIKMAITAGQPSSIPVTLNFQSGSPGSGVTLATTTVNLTSTSQTFTDFVFINPVAVTSGSSYFFYVTCAGYKIDVSTDSTQSFFVANYFHSPTWYNLTKSLSVKLYQSTNSYSLGFTATEPIDMLKSVMSGYNGAGGVVTLDPNIQNTGLSLNYTFTSQTILDAVNAVQNMTPAGWSWYVDPGTNILYMGTPNNSFQLIRRLHINDIQLEQTLESVVNSVYFTGGTDPNNTSFNIFVHQSNAASITAYGTRSAQYSDNHVTDLTTAQTIATNLLVTVPSYIATVTLLDGTIDISSLTFLSYAQPRNFDNQLNSLSFGVVGIQYTPDVLTLNLGVLPSRTSSIIEDTIRQLTYQQTIKNPNTPS